MSPRHRSQAVAGPRPAAAAATIRAKPAAAVSVANSARSTVPGGASSWKVPTAITTPMPGGHERERHRRSQLPGRAKRASLDPERGQHPDREVADVCRQRLARDVAPVVGVVEPVPADGHRDEREQEQRVQADAVRAEAEPDDRQQRQRDIERDLDRERPQHRVELHQRVQRVVLPEHREQRHFSR